MPAVKSDAAVCSFAHDKDVAGAGGVAFLHNLHARLQPDTLTVFKMRVPGGDLPFLISGKGIDSQRMPYFVIQNGDDIGLSAGNGDGRQTFRNGHIQRADEDEARFIGGYPVKNAVLYTRIEDTVRTLVGLAESSGILFEKGAYSNGKGAAVPAAGAEHFGPESGRLRDGLFLGGTELPGRIARHRLVLVFPIVFSLVKKMQLEQRGAVRPGNRTHLVCLSLETSRQRRDKASRACQDAQQESSRRFFPSSLP